MDSLRGRLLIASPVLVDPNFHRTVVLIAEHTAGRANHAHVLFCLMVFERWADAHLS